MLRLARDSLALVAAGMALGALAAALVAAVGAQAALRGWYGLDPAHPAGVTADVVLRRNLTLVAGVLAAAVTVASWPRLRAALDALLALVLGGNSVLVGAALGAYGNPLLRLIAPHAALELAAAAAAAAGYLDARRARAARPARLAACGGAATALLTAGAVIESGAGR
jgi:hypothetical protein